jgi:pimeloyl-ACP methyl ester carboxylesterase
MHFDENHSVPTDLGTLHVRVTGVGPVAVLWHSLFVDSRNWARVETALAARRTLVIVDGPSHGFSDPAQQRFTLDDCAAAAVDVLDQFGFTGAVDWVGNAWGGHVGLLFAAAYPYRCRSLVTIATPVHALRGWERRQCESLVLGHGLIGPSRLVLAPLVRTMIGAQTRRDWPEAETFLVDTMRSSGRRGMRLAMQSIMLGRPDVGDVLPRVKAPTLMITGGDDAMWTPAQAEAAALRMPDGRAASVAGARHLPPLEAPGEVARLVIDAWAEALSARAGQG